LGFKGILEHHIGSPSEISATARVSRILEDSEILFLFGKGGRSWRWRRRRGGK